MKKFKDYIKESSMFDGDSPEEDTVTISGKKLYWSAANQMSRQIEMWLTSDKYMNSDHVFTDEDRELLSNALSNTEFEFRFIHTSIAGDVLQIIIDEPNDWLMKFIEITSTNFNL